MSSAIEEITSPNHEIKTNISQSKAVVALVPSSAKTKREFQLLIRLDSPNEPV